MIDTFTAQTNAIGPRRWIKVRIHPDEPDLQRAAHKLSPHDQGRSYWDDCAGVFHGVAGDTWGGYVGLLRLARNRMDDEIYAHELIHAAVAVLRSYGVRDVRLGAHVTNREEQLAYIYGDLHAGFLRALR